MQRKPSQTYSEIRLREQCDGQSANVRLDKSDIFDNLMAECETCWLSCALSDSLVSVRIKDP